jgi:2-oxoglutarate ferredoxin oxidoreductase subunit alpha
VQEDEVSVLIGGRAGDGISSAGQVICQILGQLGFGVHMYFDYPSLVKGGHNFAIIRGARGKIGAVRSGVDFILALNQETVNIHSFRLADPGVVLYNADSVKLLEGIAVPIKDILAAEQAPLVMGNSAMIGAFVRAAAIDWKIAESVLRKSIPKGIDQNLSVARRSYDNSRELLPIKSIEGPRFPVFTGNEAIGLGLAEGDLDCYFGYPMSPTSNILHFLAAHAEEFRIRVIQPESEIAVVLMALGCAYAGTRAAVGTSGGGFCLMTEALGLSGIAELPVLIILGQRTGPSTGLATYTAQADLNFALSAGQGEFPRLIIAPGDAGEARKWSTAGLDLAWKYQMPAILLSDKIICEGMYTLDPQEICTSRSEAVLDTNADHPYLRYAVSPSGISPLRFPPVKGEYIKVNSHVHDPDGITTEDPETTTTMADKRKRKMEYLKEEIEQMQSVNVWGEPDSEKALLCWGSNKGVCNELGSKMGFRVIQPVVLWPFPERNFESAMKGVTRFYCIETNETGQLSRLLKQFGFTSEEDILKYDGRPYMVEELETELRRVIA